MQKSNFNDDIEAVKNSFADCSDFNCREIKYCENKKGFLFNIGGYTDRQYITEGIIIPLMKIKNVPSDKNDIFGCIVASEVSIVEDADAAVEKLLTGFAVLFLELKNGYAIYSCMVKRAAQRSVQEPNGEVVVRGPREGFIENSEDNLALLRKRLKTKNFKVNKLSIGELTDTTVYICYIENVASSETIDKISTIISSIKIPAVLDSGYIEHFLNKSSFSLLPNVGNSEKPDIVAAKLLEGRVGIICDGSPVVLTAPYLFIESIQSSEDYLKTPLYATFIRFLRFLSTLIALYLPAIYLSTVEHHTAVLPYKLYKTIMELRQDVPFGVFGELMVILIIFEIIREVGIRMPRAVGSAVGIVAGLILGDAAINAGIASAPVIVTASLTAVCTFIAPPFMNSIVLVRFLNIFAAKIFGFPGIVLSLCIIASAMCKKESFGVPYLMPISPVKPNSLNDSLFSLPQNAIKKVKNSIYNNSEE